MIVLKELIPDGYGKCLKPNMHSLAADCDFARGEICEDFSEEFLNLSFEYARAADCLKGIVHR